MALKLIVKLWALATVRGLLPVIVPLNNDANGTQWGPVTADISANRCRAFAVAFDRRRPRGGLAREARHVARKDARRRVPALGRRGAPPIPRVEEVARAGRRRRARCEVRNSRRGGPKVGSFDLQTCVGVSPELCALIQAPSRKCVS